MEKLHTAMTLNDWNRGGSLGSMILDLFHDPSDGCAYQVDWIVRMYRKASREAGSPFGEWKNLEV